MELNRIYGAFSSYVPPMNKDIRNIYINVHEAMDMEVN